MRVLEFEAKALLKNQGMSVPRGEVVTSAAEAREAAAKIAGPVVLKAQIPSGRRMKAGAVVFAANPDEAASAAGSLLGRSINNFAVDRVLVEERIAFEREVYLAATYDTRQKSATLIASNSGGIEVESASEVIRRTFSVRAPVADFLGREIAADLGFHGPDVLALGKVIGRLASSFLEWDAVLLELNPVVRDAQGKWWVADAHLDLDDEALLRQAEILGQLPISRGWAARRSEIETRAAEIDAKDHRGVAGRLVAFDGDLGLLVGGGGASLTTMDALLDAGLRPANYCEIGGNPSVWKVKELTKLILSLPRVEKIAVIMNVVSNTRVDLVARGVIKGVLESGKLPRETIVGFRIPGSWEAEGQDILRHYGVRSFGREVSIDQVVDAIKCQS
jgi:succinyl-CoA synthetase beta subunit/citryl-CoA synthetase large subunit